jgi:hypothetical protein
MATTDVLARMRGAARTYAKPGMVAPHRPVHTVHINTCGVCGHIIGFDPDTDPVHAIPGPCSGCGVTLPPMRYRCETCQQRDAEQRERERQARLATYRNVEPAEGDVSDDEPERDRGERHYSPKYEEAKRYAASYTGTFEFMLDMKLRVTGPRGVRFPLTERQVEAILKCKRADEERAARLAAAQRERVQTGRDLTVLPVGRTYAAVDNDSGGVTFLIIDRPAPNTKWDGWVFVKQQVSDDEVRLGAQRPGESYVGQFANLIDKVLADPVGAVARYGLELGVCGICGRALTNDESRELGIGPICRAKIAA